jgi:hypothetical protein
MLVKLHQHCWMNPPTESDHNERQGDLIHCDDGLLEKEGGNASGAQTERRGGAGPVRGLTWR